MSTSTRNQTLKSNTENSKLKTQNQHDIPLRKEKNTATFGDIWGLMSHFHAKTRGPRPRKTKASNDRYVNFAHAENGADNQDNQDGRGGLRESKLSHQKWK